ncbi:MAG TPA: DNA repair exonuclease [Limnochordales bacterium]
MIRILHLADLHLGWTPHYLGPRAEERRRERDSLLRRTVDWVLQARSADMVIIAGDLFESHRPPPALAEQVLGDLARLEQAGVAVVTVPGNHDEITYHDSVYRQLSARWPGVLIRDPMPTHAATLQVAGVPVHIYGLAYTGGLTQTQPPLRAFPRLEAEGLHVAVFHGSLEWDAGERSLPLMLDALAAARYDYVALGHIHQHQVHRLPGGLAVYPGMIEGKGFSDPGVGHYTVAVLGAGPARVETVHAGARPVRVVELDVTPCLEPKDVEDRIRALADSQAIVQVRLTGAAPGRLPVAAWQERWQAGFYHLELVDETTALDEGVVAAWAAEPTVRGQFVRRMQAALAQAGDARERLLVLKALRYGLAALEGQGS